MEKRYPILDEMRDVVIANEYIFGSPPAFEHWISKAERDLGVRFPPSYRQYLNKVGAYGTGDRMIHGLSTPDGPGEYNKNYADVVSNTLHHRELAAKGQSIVEPGFHSGLIEIGYAWESTLRFFLDTIHVDEEGEGPVLARGHFVPWQRFAPNFIAFLQQMVGEEDPFSGVVKDPPSHRPEPASEPEDNRVNRSIAWLGVDPDPAAPPGPPNARFFGLDTDSRDVFVHAKGAGLDLMQQLAASEANAFFFANPSGIGTTGEPFVAIDYILEHHPEIETAGQLREIREAVRAAYDQAGPGDGN